MNKHRIHTTISPKHWELLQKYTGKYETQQKVIEFALENLENTSKQEQIPSPEEQLVIRGCREIKVCLVVRDILKVLTETADLERLSDAIANQRTVENLIVWLYQKPLKKCSLKEIIDGLAIIIKSGNVADTFSYSDDGDCYTLKVIHSMGMNHSIIFKLFIENPFKAYGVKTESELSGGGVFIKIYKDLYGTT